MKGEKSPCLAEYWLWIDHYVLYCGYVLSPLGRRAVIGAGLCGGWAVASRYTNIIFLPALMAFFTMIMAHAQGHSLSLKALRELQSVWISHLLVGALAVGVAVSPMLIKNWLLVGCPLMPHIGCQDTYWA